MIVHRFMSNDEYRKLMSGQILVNITDHRKKRKNTTSHGFCFFAEDPDEAVHWLSGIVCMDRLVTFEVPDGFLVKGTAMYADESKFDPTKPLRLGDHLPMVKRTEYWRTRYSKADMQPITSTDKYAHLYPTLSEQKQIMNEFIRTGII